MTPQQMAMALFTVGQAIFWYGHTTGMGQGVIKKFERDGTVIILSLDRGQYVVPYTDMRPNGAVQCSSF